jgi:hypothetical protein
VESTWQRWQIPDGAEVVGSDGDKVGKVIGANESYVVVEKGFFFPTDYYIPVSAVTNVDGDRVHLNVTKHEALTQGWDTIPGDETVGTKTGAFITGATGYDETIGLPTEEGVSLTDADLRVAGALTPDDSLAEPRLADEPRPDEETEPPLRGDDAIRRE